jgi:phytoene dehydrogenase-like protein
MSSALLRSTLPMGREFGIDIPTRCEAAKDRRPPGKRVAIIGAGFGGLAAAIRLQAAGMVTVLYEARDKAGGCAYVYEQDGFTFDAGPTVITAPTCLEELFTLAGRRMDDYVELLPVHPDVSAVLGRRYGHRLRRDERHHGTGNRADRARRPGRLSPLRRLREEGLRHRLHPAGR